MNAQKRPPTPTSRLMRRLVVHGAQLAIAVICLVAWDLTSGTVIDKLLISDPMETWTQFVEWLRDGTILGATLDTLSAVGAGLLIGSAAGIPAGWVVGSSKSIGRAVTPPITVLFAIPKVALVPLFILWFGISYSERVVFTATVVFFFMYFAALNGIKSVPTALRNHMELAGANVFQKLVFLYCPASVGWILGGCRVAVPYAFVAAVTAEVIASRNGIGALIKSSSSVLNPAGIFVGIIILMVITSGAGLAVGSLERWSKWRL